MHHTATHVICLKGPHQTRVDQSSCLASTLRQKSLVGIDSYAPSAGVVSRELSFSLGLKRPCLGIAHVPSLIFRPCQFVIFEVCVSLSEFCALSYCKFAISRNVSCRSWSFNVDDAAVLTPCRLVSRCPSSLVSHTWKLDLQTAPFSLTVKARRLLESQGIF